MGFISRLQPVAEELSDQVFRWYPQKPSSLEMLSQCRIVGHRGQTDGNQTLENTIDAFQHCLNAGLWGVEFDIRWTKDNEPIILHDPNTQRVFGGSRLYPGDFTLAQLKEKVSLIPSLQEVVDQFATRMHLMIELKEPLGAPDGVRQRKLQSILQALAPEKDYHFLSLNPLFFDELEIAPPHALLPVAELNPSFLSERALQHGWAGLSGHYLLVNRDHIQVHHERNQKIGTGFVESKNCLYRELNRSVDWIFTNRPVWLQKLVKQLVSELRLEE